VCLCGKGQYEEYIGWQNAEKKTECPTQNHTPELGKKLQSTPV
jgi:hypothetical protein